MAEVVTGRVREIEQALGGRSAIINAVQSNAPLAGGGGGGSTPGAGRVIRCPFAHDTPNLLAGAALYTPTVGDILLNAWIEVDTPWLAGSALADVGDFLDTTWGWFGSLNGPVNVTNQDSGDVFNFRLLSQSGGAKATDLLSSGIGAYTPPIRTVPAKFATADPVRVVVSQDGHKNGADPGSSQGAATLYLMVATPAST